MTTEEIKPIHIAVRPRPDHAKAELALRFLEFVAGPLDKKVVALPSATAIGEIEQRCWVIISEYFRP